MNWHFSLKKACNFESSKAHANFIHDLRELYYSFERIKLDS